MPSFTECKTCGRWSWEDHRCPPAWVVAPEDEPSLMMTVHGADAEEAAEKAAERYDSDGDYYLARGNEMVFLVGRAGGEIVRVSVEGETVPSYRAMELGPAESGTGVCQGSEADTAQGNPATDEPKPHPQKAS